MRLLELINESISVSKHTSAVRAAVGAIILKIITTQYNKRPLSNKDEMSRVERIYRTKFEESLVDILSKLTTQFTKKSINVEFKNTGESTGAYLEDENTIVIHTSIISSFVRAALVFHKSKQSNALDVNTLKFVNGVKDQAIVRLTNIFLHEITHAIQVQRGGKFEYKHGYIEPDTKNFFTAMAGENPDKEKSKDIYFSQPDEISAYAQQKAVELINTIYKKPLPDQITAVDALLKDIAKHSSNHQYADFGKNTDHRYKKVYKRYLKLVYQELTRYKDTIDKNI